MWVSFYYGEGLTVALFDVEITCERCKTVVMMSSWYIHEGMKCPSCSQDLNDSIANGTSKTYEPPCSDVNTCKPLLTIELQDESAVPKVFYKGEEIKARSHISFDWKTKQSHEGTGGLDMRIEHYDNEIEALRIIGRKRGEFM